MVKAKIKESEGAGQAISKLTTLNSEMVVKIKDLYSRMDNIQTKVDKLLSRAGLADQV